MHVPQPVQGAVLAVQAGEEFRGYKMQGAYTVDDQLCRCWEGEKGALRAGSWNGLPQTREHIAAITWPC